MKQGGGSMSVKSILVILSMFITSNVYSQTILEDIASIESAELITEVNDRSLSRGAYYYLNNKLDELKFLNGADKFLKNIEKPSTSYSYRSTTTTYINSLTLVRRGHWYWASLDPADERGKTIYTMQYRKRVSSYDSYSYQTCDVELERVEVRSGPTNDVIVGVPVCGEIIRRSYYNGYR